MSDYSSSDSDSDFDSLPLWPTGKLAPPPGFPSRNMARTKQTARRGGMSSYNRHAVNQGEPDAEEQAEMLGHLTEEDKARRAELEKAPMQAELKYLENRWTKKGRAYITTSPSLRTTTKTLMTRLTGMRSSPCVSPASTICRTSGCSGPR